MELGRELGWVARRAGVRANLLHTATFPHRIPEYKNSKFQHGLLGRCKEYFSRQKNMFYFQFSSVEEGGREG